MRQETINIYQFEELSDEAKKNAFEWYRNGQEIHWGDEWIDSLKSFCKKFDIELCDWSYGFYEGARISTNIEYLEYGKDYTFNHETLKRMGIGDDCPFTGFCADEDLLAPIRAIKEGENPLRIDILQECLDSWLSGFNADIESQQSDEYIADHIIANEYEFTIDGKRY